MEAILHSWSRSSPSSCAYNMCLFPKSPASRRKLRDVITIRGPLSQLLNIGSPYNMLETMFNSLDKFGRINASCRPLRISVLPSHYASMISTASKIRRFVSERTSTTENATSSSSSIHNCSAVSSRSSDLCPLITPIHWPTLSYQLISIKLPPGTLQMSVLRRRSISTYRLEFNTFAHPCYYCI